MIFFTPSHANNKVSIEHAQASEDLIDFAVYTRETHKLGRWIYCCFEIRFAE